MPAGAEVVFSTAVPPDNPERRAAAGRELHRSELLAQIAALRRCLAVTGTHGKTTTAAMIVHILRGCGLDPAYVVGGELGDTGVNAGWGRGEWIVVEADESDRSLLKLWPEIAVLTNAELDHHSTYGSRLDLEETLREFMGRAGDRRGRLGPPRAAGAVPAGRRARLRRRRRRDVSARLAVSLARDRGVAGRSRRPQRRQRRRRADRRGAGRRRPGAAAAAALADFRGARRRFELLGSTESGIPIYDDYAHHPTEVAATIAAARTLAPARLVAVFQPHLYSRTRALAREFGRALAGADVAVVLAVYPARERAEDFPGVDGHLIAAAAADAAGGRRGRVDAVVRRRAPLPVARRCATGDLCLAMGAGDVDALARSLRRVARRRVLAGPPSTLLAMAELPPGVSATTRWPA